VPQGSPLPAAVPSSIRFALPRRTALLAVLVASLAVVAFATLPVDRAVIAAFLAGVLAVLSAIDIERGIIPNRIVLPASCLVLMAQLAVFPNRALEWTLAPIVLAFLLAIPGLLGRAWMGMGDVKLALLLGAGLGWGAFSALPVASVCVFPAALIVLIRGGVAARNATIPFGPFMSLGALIVLFGPHLAGLPSS
jgi:leader peptidase (prepilin peptidase)/N-methyltransferase